MHLLNELNSLPLLRPLGIPDSLCNVCLIVLKDDLRAIEKLMADHPSLKPKAICLPDLPDRVIKTMRIELPDGSAPEIISIANIVFYPQYEKIFICPSRQNLIAPYLTEICRFLADTNINFIYLYGKSVPEHSLRPAMTDFYSNNITNLAKAYSLLSDWDSKNTFVARIKAIITGNSGYLPISAHKEYFHPLIHPDSGDILIDGGVSDLIESQKDFAEAVTDKGHVYGFEPIPRLYESAHNQLASYNNYTLTCAGLAENEGIAKFDDLRDSSHISTATSENPDKVDCRLETIDNFCLSQHIHRVDCIKLDIEGAELLALKGAIKTIRKDLPKLIICLYHNPADLYEIPIFINSLDGGYKIYISHSSCQFMDTILYAIHDNV